ncbi:MAG: co-chaperone GroES [Candidatus Gracilibacteria bacterium]|jgi:chaperonin GroES
MAEDYLGRRMGNIIPTGNRVLIKKEKLDGGTKKVGNIIVMVTEKQKKILNEGFIVSCGKNVENYKPGDYVVYDKYTGTEIERGDDCFLIIPEDDVIAIIEEEK